MLSLQEQKLLDTGEYMVVSVNDEFYNPDPKAVQDNRQSEYPPSISPREKVKANSIFETVELYNLIYAQSFCSRSRNRFSSAFPDEFSV